jgi:hypothetical protein
MSEDGERSKDLKILVRVYGFTRVSDDDLNGDMIDV